MNAMLDLAEPEQVGLSSYGLAQIDRMLADLIDAKVLPGAVTLVARNGKVVHRSAQGFKDLASGEKLSFDSIFRIYSMTKPVTAAAMMILYDQGLWSPDDPIAKHLPEFADVKGAARIGARSPADPARTDDPHGGVRLRNRAWAA